MVYAGRHSVVVAILIALSVTTAAPAKGLTVGVVQTVIEDTLDKNLVKLTRFIDQAKERGCRLVIFPEGALFWDDIAREHPTKAGLDAAISELGRCARSAGVYTIFGVTYKSTDRGPYHNRGVVFDPNGERLVFYEKNMEVPRRFSVEGGHNQPAPAGLEYYLPYQTSIVRSAGATETVIFAMR